MVVVLVKGKGCVCRSVITEWLKTLRRLNIELLIPAGPSGDAVPVRRIKMEPPEGDVIQVTVPGKSADSPPPVGLRWNLARFPASPHSQENNWKLKS